MAKPAKKIGYYLLRSALLAFFGIGIFARCATVMAPMGGPIDTLPPIVVAMTPAYGTTHFNTTDPRSKRIFIEFNEYVKLQDQQKEVYTAPFMKKKPTILIRGRGIQIDIPDTLKENTTYAINFGSSVQDNNEGNPLHGLRFVFSTGDTVDSLVMSGYTADAYTADSVAKTFILFYAADKAFNPECDSTVFNYEPDFVARSENYGTFLAENLKPIDYRIYALDDRNGNQLYEPGVDQIAFLDSVYNPAQMPSFNLREDTLRKYLIPDPQLYFRLFLDEQFKRQYLAGQNRVNQHLIVLNFGAKYPEIENLTFEGIDTSKIIREYLKPTRDSIAFWLNIPAEELPDTIKGEVTYLKHDSINRLIPTTQQLALGWKAFESKQEEKERLKREKEREEALAEGREPPKEPNPFKYKAESSNEINPERGLSLTFDFPLTQIDSGRVSLIRIGEEEKLYKVRVWFEPDTTNMRRWTIRAPWANGQKYKLEIPSGVFRNVAGQSNDTMRAEFSVMDPEKFATLVMNVKGKADSSQYILQLLDQNGKLLEEKRHVQTGKYTFRFVEPGNVRLRVIEDLNGNGVWDKGNLVERRQPERVEIYSQESGEEEIASKANWEMEFDIDMNEVFAPITMERVTEQLYKREKIRVEKMLKARERMGPSTQNRNRSQTTTPAFGGASGRGYDMQNFNR